MIQHLRSVALTCKPEKHRAIPGNPVQSQQNLARIARIVRIASIALGCHSLQSHTSTPTSGNADKHGGYFCTFADVRGQENHRHNTGNLRAQANGTGTWTHKHGQMALSENWQSGKHTWVENVAKELCVLTSSGKKISYRATTKDHVVSIDYVVSGENSRVPCSALYCP